MKRNFAKVYSAEPIYLQAECVTVEADLSKGLHSFSIVGLPDKAVEESRDRVSAAIKNSGFTSPKSKNQKTVISLAPADLKKEGPIFDLAIALAYLLASGDISFEVKRRIFLGELSLDGELRRVRGVLPSVLEAKRLGFEEVFVPEGNAQEAALVSGIAIYGAHTLNEVIAHLDEEEGGTPLLRQRKTVIRKERPEYTIDLGDIRGQESAKRGLEIAAAGRHNIALYGPPGTGKTMLAKAFCHMLPALSFDEVLEVTAIHSVAGALAEGLITHPPFRSPHHTSSYVSLVGGGTTPKPGEVTLAHRGVLFLDEFPEFERRSINALRQPLEEKTISISRARGSSQFPANFILIAAMNPCPCGSFGTSKECVCLPTALMRYQRKISGPIVDRIDMWIEVPHFAHEKLSVKGEPETEAARKRVLSARQMQEKRFSKAKRRIRSNSDMNVKDLEKYVSISPEVQALLNKSATSLDLSPRAYHRVIKLARTIADLEGGSAIEEKHILEAIQYRPRQNFFA
jgi:magnesium chelatase family protein